MGNTTTFSCCGFIATLLFLIQALSTTSANGCAKRSSKWKDLGGDFCYIIELNDTVTWIDAVYRCFSEGGSLASFHSDEETERIMNYVNDEKLRLHIGLRRKKNGGFEWVDGRALDFVNWYPGEPNLEFEKCVEMYVESGKWNDVDCSAEFGYICSSSKNPLRSKPVQTCPETSPRWRDFGGEACYIVEKETEATWDDALRRCTEEGGSLASFHSIEEVSAVLQYTKDYHRMFLIGLRQNDNGEYEWTDGSPHDLDYRGDPVEIHYWDIEETDTIEEKCAQMDSHSGHWSDASCGKPSAYICSSPKVCGGDIFADEGVLQSPNFPENYGPGEECVWRITVPENHRIYLKFFEFDIDYSYRCYEDYLEVRDEHETNSSSEQFCGSIVPEGILTSGNKITVVFASDESKEKGGFFAEFKKDSCGGSIFGEAGVIISPNHPDAYRRNEHCIWKVTVEDGHEVSLRFILFDLETSMNCRYDFVEIRDGHESDSPIIGRFCGFEVPEEIRSSSNEVALTFESDAFIERDGFIIAFEKAAKPLQPVAEIFRKLSVPFVQQKTNKVRSRILNSDKKRSRKSRQPF